MAGRAPCAEDGFSFFFFFGGTTCTPPVPSADCCTLGLSLGGTLGLSLGDTLGLSLGGTLGLSLGGALELSLLGLFPLTISFGTRLASWLLPFNGTRDPELSVSRKQYRGKAQGLRTREKKDLNTKVREESEGEKRSPPTLFLFFTNFYYYFN